MSRLQLSNTSWECVKDLLPQERGGKKGRPAKNVLLSLRAGTTRGNLPAEYGVCNRACPRFRRSTERGLWQKIFMRLSEDKNLENIIIDETYIRARQRADGAKGDRRNGLLAIVYGVLPANSAW